MTKKGKIEEIINKAKYFEGIETYSVVYRDLDDYVEISLEEWITISEMDSIPVHRIYKIKKLDEIVFERPLR